MALGMKTMAKRSVIVRKLDSLESLGGITNICSDKTGTLTQGKMVTRKAWIPGVGIYTVKGCEEALNPTSGHVTLIKDSQNEADRKKKDEERSALALKFDAGTKDGGTNSKQNDDTEDQKVEQDVVPELEAFLQSTALCNLSNIRFADKKVWKATGDPTEVALQVFSHRFAGYGKKDLLETGWKQLGEYPFDSDIKRMTVAFQAPTDTSVHIFTKGAVERILELCTTIGFGKHEKEMTEDCKAGVLQQMNALADQGLRVLAIARRKSTEEVANWAEFPREAVENKLSLIGLAGLYDPPRLETAQSVRECTEAGIKVHMLTGKFQSNACNKGDWNVC
jgi:P-type Na+/K+ transporter